MNCIFRRVNSFRTIRRLLSPSDLFRMFAGLKTSRSILVLSIATFIWAGGCTGSSELDDTVEKFNVDLKSANSELQLNASRVIHVSCPDDASLLIVPSYESRSSLKESLAITNGRVLSKVHSISSSDSTAPALVWINENGVVGHRPLNAGVGLRISPLRLSPENKISKIRLTKVESPAGFHELEFRAEDN